MSTYAFIINVIFAVFIIHFVSGFLNGLFKNPKARIWADWILGIILLILVISANN